MTPITKERLIKSGWESKCYCCYLDLPNNAYLSWHLNGNFYLVISNTDTDSDCEELFQKLDIKYIEQVKALYLALTNKPLTIEL